MPRHYTNAPRDGIMYTREFAILLSVSIQPASFIQPLTARSVVLSTLLGYHPPELPVSTLIRVAALFGIPEGTVRVTLGRMVGDDDLIAANGSYRLTDRLVARQRRQD